MRRWHEDYPKTHREWREHYLSHVRQNISYSRAPGRDPFEIDCICDEQPGRFRKRRAWGCGKTRCLLCHSEKYPKRQTSRDERRSEIKLREGIEDLAAL
jgi:hypothetical protein